MKIQFQVAFLALFFCACQSKAPEAPVAKSTVEIKEVGPEEKPYQAFSILTLDPKSFVFSPPLLGSTLATPAKPTTTVSTLKWKKTNTKKSEQELSAWLGNFNCGHSPLPEWTDDKKGKTIQLGSQCFNAGFKFPLTAEEGTMQFQSSPYSAAWASSLSLDEKLPFFENEWAQFLELPLDSESAQFVLILPKKEFDLESSMNTFTKANFKTAFTKLKDKRIRLKMPAFSIQKPLFAKKAMQLGGLESVFQSKNAPADVVLYFPVSISASGINQKTTTPANAKPSSKMRLEFFKTLEFNHPFLFVLRNKNTDETIALGKVYAP